FEGGQPAASNKKNPGEIRYYSPGVYTIKLHASNSDGSEGTEEFTIKIDEEVLAGFDFEIIESNYPPVEVVLTNLTEGATAFKWTLKMEFLNHQMNKIREMSFFLFRANI